MKALKWMILFALVLVLGVYLDITETGSLGEKNQIERGSVGKGDEEISLHLDAEDVLKDYSYDLTVKEQLLDTQEMEECLEKAKSEIDESFCRKGQEISHVAGRVYPKDSYADGLVDAAWSFDREEIVEPDGTILEENVPKEGILVGTSVQLSCDELQQFYEFSFMVYPVEKSKGQQLIADIRKNIAEQMEERGQSFVKLPAVMNGIPLKWSQEKTHYFRNILILEALAVLGLVVSRKEDERRQWKKAQESMQIDYPEIVSKMLILCGAGMSIKQSWNKIAASYSDKREKNEVSIRPAYEELLRTSREMADGVSERIAIQRFGERTKLGCYHRFSRLLTENLQKGAKGMDAQLRREADQAFEERKNTARKLGEEAGTKMLLPMMVMLAIVMAIVIVPAVISL